MEKSSVFHKLLCLLFIISLSFFIGYGEPIQGQLDSSLIAMLNDPQFEALIKNKAHTILPRFQSHDDTKTEQKKNFTNNIDAAAQEKHKFYEEYLAKYYPKAFVIRECFFTNMTPDDIGKALKSIISLFSDTPWFYFMNDKQGFRVANYWEYIVDQCSLISEFLKKARVDVATKKVFLLDDNLNYSSYGINFNSLFKGNEVNKPRKTKNLLIYLRDAGNTFMYDFYALCFDYENKLFNLGILLQDLVMVNKYYYELEFIVEKLRNSRYEFDYQEHMKTCKELSALLKNKMGNDDAEMIESFFGDDEEAKKMARESYELGYL